MKSEIIKKLERVSLFDAIKDDQNSLDSLARLMEVRKCPKGQPIIKEGDEGEEMFILFNGDVEVCKQTLAKELYVVTKLSAENNAFFGELALVDNDRRSATVMASTDCELLVLNKNKYSDFGSRDTKVGLLITRKICQILSQRLRRANQDTVTLYEALVGEIEEST